jgi:hypothetical protein
MPEAKEAARRKRYENWRRERQKTNLVDVSTGDGSCLGGGGARPCSPGAFPQLELGQGVQTRNKGIDTRIKS